MLTRTIDGREVPAPGKWEFDPAHTIVGFSARHLVVTRVRGRFTEFTGSIHVAEQPEDSSVEVEISTASINTEVPDRDAHLRSPDFLDVENHPTITFRSTSIRPEGESWIVTGDLTILEETHPVDLTMNFLGVVTDPWGNAKAAFTAEGELVREDWGVTWNVPLEGGGLLVSKKIQLEIEAQASFAG